MSFCSWQVALAVWQEPSTSAPNANIALPLNVSLADQTKLGKLNIGSGLNYWITKSGDSFALKNNLLATELVVGQDGNVGIGTTSPSNKLSVYSTTSADGLSIDGTTYPSIILRISGTIKGYAPFVTTSSGGFFTDSLVGDMGFRSEANRVLFGVGSGASTMQVSGTGVNISGNVGIGTITPLAKLDVAGSGRFTGSATSVLTGSIDPIASATVTGVGTKFLTELAVGDRITVSAVTKTVIAIASNTSLTVDTAFTNLANDPSPDKLAAIFATKDSGNAVQMIVNDLGNVGIGTTAPGTELEVAGQVKITGGTPGLNKVLTSDATGLATWQTPTSSGITGSGTVNYVPKFTGASALGNSVISESSYGIGIGRTATSAKLEVGGDLGVYGVFGATGMSYLSGGSSVTGNETVTGSVTAAAFYYSSDARLKDNIRLIDNSLKKLTELNGVYFKWKDSGNPSMGLIAQDVEKIFPEAVSTNAGTGFKSVDYGKMVAPLIEAVKEQQKQINTLEAEIDKLKSQNAETK
jgi:hypothetical protein